MFWEDRSLRLIFHVNVWRLYLTENQESWQKRKLTERKENVDRKESWQKRKVDRKERLTEIKVTEWRLTENLIENQETERDPQKREVREKKTIRIVTTRYFNSKTTKNHFQFSTKTNFMRLQDSGQRVIRTNNIESIRIWIDFLKNFGLCCIHPKFPRVFWKVNKNIQWIYV